MPSLETAAFKAHLDILGIILSAMKGRISTALEAGGAIGITRSVPLLTLRSLTLWTFTGELVEGRYLSEPSEALQKALRRGFRNVPWSLKALCARRAEARDPSWVSGSLATITESNSEKEKLRTFDVLALRGIYCTKIDRYSLSQYTTVLSLDDPFDTEGSESEDSDMDEEDDSGDEPWRWRGSQVSSDGPDERWHWSDQSYTDEDQIDQESEDSVHGHAHVHNHTHHHAHEGNGQVIEFSDDSEDSDGSAASDSDASFHSMEEED